MRRGCDTGGGRYRRWSGTGDGRRNRNRSRSRSSLDSLNQPWHPEIPHGVLELLAVDIAFELLCVLLNSGPPIVLDLIISTSWQMLSNLRPSDNQIYMYIYKFGLLLIKSNNKRNHPVFIIVMESYIFTCSPSGNGALESEVVLRG